MKLKLSETAMTNLCSIGFGTAMMACCDPQTAAGFGLGQILLQGGFTLAALGLQKAIDLTQKDKAKIDAFVEAKNNFADLALRSIDADRETSEAVSAFFEDMRLDIHFEAGRFERYRDSFGIGDTPYAGIAEHILRGTPNADELFKREDTHRGRLAVRVLALAVEASVTAAKAKDDLHLAMSHESLRMVRFLYEEAKARGVSEAAVKAYLEKALSSGFSEGDILSWLPEWIERASVVFRSGGNEDNSFRRAVEEAERLLEAKDAERRAQASQPIMKELSLLESQEKEAAEEFRRRKTVRIEKAIDIDELAQNYDAIAEKLFKWAEIEGAADIIGKVAFAGNKALEWQQEGVHRISPSRLLMARKIFECLAKICQDQSLIKFWASSQNNLGIVLRNLGGRLDGEAGVRALTDARTAYDSALEVLTREDFPNEWARTQNNLGGVLRNLGERLDGEAGVRALADARTAYDAALEVYTRTDFPTQWATTQNNLGTVLQTLGERLGGEAGVKVLGDARTAFDAALEVRTHRDFPVDWAMTQNNLGTVLSSLGERLDGEAGVRSLADARTAYDATLQVYNRTDFPVQWAATQNNLGIVLRNLGGRLDGEAGMKALGDARAAYDAALEVYTRADFPVDWAMTQHCLAALRLVEFDKTQDATHVIQGVEAIDSALEVYRSSHHDYWTEQAERLLARLKSRLP